VGPIFNLPELKVLKSCFDSFIRSEANKLTFGFFLKDNKLSLDFRFEFS